MMTRLQEWLSGWIDILKGLTVVVTAGIYIPQWDLWWCLYCTDKNQDKPDFLDEQAEPTALTKRRMFRKEQEDLQRERLRKAQEKQSSQHEYDDHNEPAIFNRQRNQRQEQEQYRTQNENQSQHQQQERDAEQREVLEQERRQLREKNQRRVSDERAEQDQFEQPEQRTSDSNLSEDQFTQEGHYEERGWHRMGPGNTSQESTTDFMRHQERQQNQREVSNQREQQLLDEQQENIRKETAARREAQERGDTPISAQESKTKTTAEKKALASKQEKQCD